MVEEQAGELLGNLCDVFFCTHFSLTKIGVFITRKEPRTHFIVYSSFVKKLIDSKKADIGC